MRHMGKHIWLAVSLTSAAATPLAAQVTGVVTNTTATVQLKDGADAPRIFNYDGQVIAGDQGGDGLGGGATFASTSKVATDYVEFRNGNASGGTIALATSFTSVDVSFTNNSGQDVRPVLNSTITAAGMGLFVAPPACLNGITGCAPGQDFPGNFRGFQFFEPVDFNGMSGQLAGARFDFKIIGGGQVIYDLSGGFDLVRSGGANVIVTDFADAQNELNNFRIFAPPGDPQNSYGPNEYDIAWDATDILVDFAAGGLLKDGESSTLTYETTVTTYSLSSCAGQLTGACLVAYGAFGDPIGSGGGIKPSLRDLLLSGLNGSSDSAPTNVTFDSFAFKLPEFQADGTLRYDYIGLAPGVPEPASWALMLGGLALVGGALRRRRPVAALQH